jgi:hypothetical protein
MRDYEGNNLIWAFPLQFPHGIGACDTDEEERHRISYYKLLSSLSNPDNHRPDSVLVLHNMFDHNREWWKTLSCDATMWHSAGLHGC